MVARVYVGVKFGAEKTDQVTLAVTFGGQEGLELFVHRVQGQRQDVPQGPVVAAEVLHEQLDLGGAVVDFSSRGVFVGARVG